LFRPAESILILLEKGSRKVYNYSTKPQKNPEKDIGANHSHSVRAKPALNLYWEKENFLSYDF